MDGPPDAVWRLGDALKTEFLAPGAALKKPWRVFSAPTSYSMERIVLVYRAGDLNSSQVLSLR